MQAEALSLRRSLAEAQRKLQALSADTGCMIDRRVGGSAGWEWGGTLLVLVLLAPLQRWSRVSSGCSARAQCAVVWVGVGALEQLPALAD